MSSTRMTRCGTPTVANAIQRSPGRPSSRPRHRYRRPGPGRSPGGGSRPDRPASGHRAWTMPASVSRQRSPGAAQLEVRPAAGCCRAPRCRTWPPGSRPSSRTPCGRRRARPGVRMTSPSAPTPVRRSQSCATRGRPATRSGSWPGRRAGRSRCPSRSSCRRSSPLIAGPPATARRSHQTIQIASRTMRLFILLWPSTRSVNTIGNLDQAESLLPRPEAHLDLEGVAVRADAVESRSPRAPAGGST